jgi:ribulose-phosphate 3-epimerase
MADVAEAKLGPARDRLDPGGAWEVQLDGGGRAETAEVIGRGGTDVIVAGSALYRAEDMAAEVERIRSIADAARSPSLRQVAG